MITFRLVYCRSQQSRDCGIGNDMRYYTSRPLWLSHQPFQNINNHCDNGLQYSPSDRYTPSAKQFGPYWRGVLGKREYHMHSRYLLSRICVLSRGVSSLEMSFKGGTTIHHNFIDSESTKPRTPQIKLWDKPGRPTSKRVVRSLVSIHSSFTL